MSNEVPVQSQAQGLHAADDETFEGDYGYVPSDVDLDSDPFADDLSKELSHAAPKKWINRTTLVIGGLVLIVGGFLGGIQVQKHYGSSSTSAASNAAALRRNAASLFGNRGEGAGGFPGGGNAAGGTATQTGARGSTGKITLIDGSTIYVTLADGTVLTVKTTSSTKVSIAATSKVGALKVGQSVTVLGGTPDSTGSVTATSVTATKP